MAEPKKRKIAFYTWLLSIVFFIYLAGILSQRYQLPPARVITIAVRTLKELFAKPFYYRRIAGEAPAIKNTPAAQPGLNLVTKIGSAKKFMAQVIDMDGNVLHTWHLDWFQIWPEANHLPEGFLPTRLSNLTLVHGAVLMPNGDLVFNYAQLGLVRINRSSEVAWRLPYRTHHSVHVKEDGNLLVCGYRERTDPDPDIPHRPVPFDEDTVLEISPEGEILNEWVVSDIFKKNGLVPFFFMGSDRKEDRIRSDILHLNDVEPFPPSMKEGFFTSNDIMLSLRNINAVVVFDRTSLKVKFINMSCIGQHDPDFIDGNRISIYDNNSRMMGKAVGEKSVNSRIVIVKAPENTQETYYQGDDKSPFFSKILGKHQWLENGNLLVTDSMNGRGFEITSTGEIVWEYRNYVEKDTVGVVTEVQRIPMSYISLFGKSKK